MSLPPCLLQAAADRDRDRDRNGQRAASEVSALRRQDGGGARSLESEQRRRLDQRNLRSVRRAVAGALSCVLGFLAGVTVLHKKRIGPSREVGEKK
jgi:ferric-dicitrate binding protein FerR (iron transport regulator)